MDLSLTLNRHAARLNSITPFQGILVRHYHPRENKNEEDDDDVDTPRPKFEKKPFGNKSFGNRPYGDKSRFGDNNGDKPRFGDNNRDFNRGSDRPRFDGNRGGARPGGFQRDGGRDNNRNFQDNRGGGGGGRGGIGGGRGGIGGGRGGGRPGDFRGNDRRPYNPDAKPGKFSEDRFAPQARRQSESEEKPGFKKLENFSGPNQANDGAPKLTPAQKKAMEDQKATDILRDPLLLFYIFYRLPVILLVVPLFHN